jgi:hypothetical protein
VLEDLDRYAGAPVVRTIAQKVSRRPVAIGQEHSFEICPLSRRPLPAPSFLVRITLSYPDKVQRKTHFLSPEIKTRPSHFVLLCVAPEVHLKASTTLAVPIRDGDMNTP